MNPQTQDTGVKAGKVLLLLLAVLGVSILLGKVNLRSQPTSDHPELQRLIDSANAARPRVPALAITEEQVAQAFPEMAFSRRQLADGRDDFSAQAGITIVEATGREGRIEKLALISGVARDDPHTAADAMRTALKGIALVSSSPKACGNTYVELVREARSGFEGASRICEGNKITVKLGSFTTTTITREP